MKFEQNSKP